MKRPSVYVQVDQSPTSPCSLTSLPTPSRSTHAFDISAVRPQRRYSSAQNLHSPQSVRESAARRLDICRPRTEVVLQRTPTSLYERTRQPTSHPSNLVYLASSSSSSQLGGMYSPSLRQSRRASIVLQSNSFNLPAALPATGQTGGPRTAHAGDPRSLTSTKSLPYQSAEQERRRRRSIAHERYPPLVSIFEDLQSDVGRSPIKETEVNNAAFFAAADICAIHECPQKMADEQALVKRTHSSSSLISVFSSSSSSSERSTYAYIFDSARASSCVTPSTKHNTGSKRRSYIETPIGDILLSPGSLLTTHMVTHTGSTDESTALLPSSSTRPRELQPGTDDYLPTVQMWGREAGVLLRTMGPLLIGNVLQATISVSQVASSGHLGRSELAAIGLAHMVVILTGYPIAFSTLSCLETCASQAFTSSQPKLVGGYFVRALQVQWIAGLGLGAFWFTSGPLLARILHSASDATVELAVEYLRWYFVPFMVFSNQLCARQVLFAQGITNPLPYLTLLGMLTTVGAQWLLVWSPYFRLGISGIALSNGLSYLLMLCATLWVISRNNMHRIWGGIGFHAPWLPFLRLMPPCLVLALFSTGTNELITMATTQLGASSLAVQSVLSALGRMFMISASSAGVASLNRTGNLIGERAVRGACITAHVSLCIGLAIAVLGGLALALAPELWIGMFTSDPATIDDAVRLLPVAAVAYATQAVSFVGSQLISAQGRQGLAVRIKTITLYTIGVPLGYYWTMVEDHGLLGLWAAVAVGQACTAAAETIVLLRTRWPELIEKCSSTITSSV